MKAIIVAEFGGPEMLKYVDMDIPTIEDNEVLIKVAATSVNFADIKARKGNKGKRKVPFIPGIDVAGIIEKVGANVQNVSVGQRVIAFPLNGSYAEYVTAKESLTFVIPDSIDFETAAACPIVAFLSYNLLHNVARLEDGETVVVHAAAGGVGTTAIQMAKILGAEKVIGIVGSEEKVSVAQQAGSDYVVNHSKEDFAEKVNELTGGKGVNIILDSIAGRVTEESLNCLAPFGRLVQFGNASGEIGRIESKDLHNSCRSVIGYSFGTTRKLRPNLVKPTADKVLPMIADGKLKIKVGRHFALEDAAKAHEWIESRQSTGKIILKVND